MFSKFNNFRLWLKEYSRPCPRKVQFSKNDAPFIIIGHRGAPYKEPENTIPSFEQAMIEGANGLEIDLSLTKDKHVIVWHDWDPNHLTAILRESGLEPWVKYKPHPPHLLSENRKPINQLTLEEIRKNFDYKKRKGKLHLPARAHIPTLEEFYEWAVKKKNLLYVFFDNKAPEAEKGCAVEILDKIKSLHIKYNNPFKVVIETTFEGCLNEMKNAHPDFSYSLDVEPPAGFVFEPGDYSALDKALSENNDFAIGLRPRKITIANWTTFRRIMQNDTAKLRNYRNMGNNELKLIAATVSKRKELRCLVRLGVDGIQTDFPGRLKRIAEHYKRRIEKPSFVKNVAV